MKTKKIAARSKILSKYLTLAEQLIRSDGKLPCVTWLRKHGYANLYQYMRAHPRDFKHIKQEVRTSSIHDKARIRHQQLAKQLAKENGGILPTVAWLTSHGHSDLVSYMSKHPSFFTGLKRERIADKHIKTAEKMAKRYKGILPGSTVIIETQGWALYKFIRRNPCLFNHIPGAPTKVNRNVNGHSSKRNGKKTRTR